MSSQPVLVEGRSLLGTRSRNRRVYSQQVMQEAGVIYQPYVAGIFTDFTPEELQKLEKEWRKSWKERHINEIKEAGEDYDC